MEKRWEYQIGDHVWSQGIKGKVIPCFKPFHVPGDIYIEWETGEKSSYDREWLAEWISAAGRPFQEIKKEKI